MPSCKQLAYTNGGKSRYLLPTIAQLFVLDYFSFPRKTSLITFSFNIVSTKNAEQLC